MTDVLLVLVLAVLTLLVLGLAATRLVVDRVGARVLIVIALVAAVAYVWYCS